MNTSPTKGYSPLLRISIYATILLSFCTYIIGGENELEPAEFAPGNASKIWPSPSSTTAGRTPETELSPPLLRKLLENLKRDQRLRLPFGGRRQRNGRQAEDEGEVACRKEADSKSPELCPFICPPWITTYCECLYSSSIHFNKSTYPTVCPRHIASTTTSTTTTPLPTTTTPTPTYGNFTCFVCDNGIQKNERCQDGSKHADWDMTTSQRCNTVDEFFSAYDTIRYEFARRFPHAEKRDAFRSEDDGKMHRPTVHLCVSLAVRPSKKGVDIKVVRGCIYGHNGDIVNGFLGRLKVSPNLDNLGDGSIVDSMTSCKATELSGEEGGVVKKVEICVCNHGQRCNHNPIAGAGLTGPFRQLLLLLIILVLSLSTVIQI